MNTRIILLALTCSILTSCNSAKKQKNDQQASSSLENKTTEKQEIRTTIVLDKNFILEIGGKEDFGSFVTYSFLKLSKDKQTIFIDSSLTEYEFNGKIYPIFLETGINTFELLLEVNDRPSKNYSKKLIIKENEVIKVEKLPSFISNSKDLNNDGKKELAGFWDYSQTWGENFKWTDYNPILYYSITAKGTLLDSSLTKERNEFIYGKFHGFEINQKLEIPESVSEKFGQEIKLIEDKK